MAERPWVSPQEVKDYTEYAAVRERADAKLALDVSRAESYVIAYVNNNFADVETVPDNVKTAALLLAEAYAYNAANAASAPNGGYKSETFDDYSYTLADNADIDIGALDLAALLGDYVTAKSQGGVCMRMRKL